MAGFSRILVMDTALQGCGVGVYDARHNRAVSRYEAMERGQAEYLMPAVEKLLQEADVAYGALDGIVTTVGPGTFTGLRLGLSAARSMALALGIPVFGITTLQALAIQYTARKNPGSRVGVLIETKRDDFYFQRFHKDGRPEGKAMAAGADAVAGELSGLPCVLIGNALGHFAELAGCPDNVRAVQDAGVIDPAYIAELFCKSQTAPGAAEEEIFTAPMPVYLRGADVSAPKTPPRRLKSQNF